MAKMVKVTVTKIVLSGCLKGLELSDSYTTTERQAKDRLKKHLENPNEIRISVCCHKYRILKIEIENI